MMNSVLYKLNYQKIYLMVLNKILNVRNRNLKMRFCIKIMIRLLFDKEEDSH